MKLKIPSQIDLAGQTFQVIVDPNLRKVSGCCGQTHFDDGIIIVDQNLSADTKAVTYYHELVHAILVTMGSHDLNKDESFVDNFANLLWQSQKSSKF